MARLRKKFILVVLDGAADRPCSELGNKTPYEIAFKPNLDWFAANGKTGMMIPLKKGVAPESDSAVMAILGYDPYFYFTGRGPLEAYGSGIPFKIGDLAVRANFATVSGKKIVDRRVGRGLTSREAAIFAKAINKQVKLGFPFIFKSTVQHRGVLVVRGSFSENITNTDPGYERKGKVAIAVKKNRLQISRPLDDEEVTQLSANIINNFVEQSNKLLSKHPLNIARVKKGLLPANIVITRDAGIELPELPKKAQKWLALVSMPLEIGLAKLAGMFVKKFAYPEMKTPNVYAHLYNSLKIYMQFVRKQLADNWNNYDCFYIHIKETDVPGHDGLPLHKRKMIEAIDEMLFSFLRKKKVSLCVTSDHTTPCKLRMHSGDAVPFLIFGKGKDSVKRFDEKSCRKGVLRKIYAKNLLKQVLE